MSNDPSTKSSSSLADGHTSNTTTPTIYSDDSPAKPECTKAQQQPSQPPSQCYPYFSPHIDASPYSSYTEPLPPIHHHTTYISAPQPPTPIYPATPSDFAELFPSSRELLIRHDDTTVDGNMNLRVDADVYSA
ncbi:MAG: hypothetical protein INR71_08560, partial [Terriglobus roseus]|nr:hypothetical protein [Terriglobus roseus]